MAALNNDLVATFQKHLVPAFASQMDINLGGGQRPRGETLLIGGWNPHKYWSIEALAAERQRSRHVCQIWGVRRFGRGAARGGVAVVHPAVCRDVRALRRPFVYGHVQSR